MQNLIIKTICLFACVVFSSCEKIDLRSALVSYENVNERFNQSMEWNARKGYQKIITADNEYKIMVMADSHIGSTENYNLFIEHALQEKSLAVVMNGDITTGRSEDYKTLSDILPDKNDMESFLTVGNHDLYFNGWKEFYARFGASVYYFIIKTPLASDLFICLDTGSGTLGEKQMKWLTKLLASERKKYRHCVVFTHVNFFRTRHTGSTNPPVEELHVIMDLFLTYQVNLLITGHDHEKSVEVLGNTTYITMDALLDGFSQAGCLKLHVKNQGVDYSFINF